MTQHTPGPWYVESSGSADEFQEPLLHISPEDGFGVRPIFRATVTMFPVRKSKIGGPKHKELADECEANARLIAAAPDLLDALKYARRFLKPADHDTASIDDVIAKATGSAA